MILLLVGAAKKCWSILEQPLTSVMEHHPSFQKTLALIRLAKLSIRMHDFGGETPKPTLLYSSHFECSWNRFYFFHLFTLCLKYFSLSLDNPAQYIVPFKATDPTHIQEGFSFSPKAMMKYKSFCNCASHPHRWHQETGPKCLSGIPMVLESRASKVGVIWRTHSIILKGCLDCKGE